MVMKGQKINDRYQIIKLIGEGGMANVYLAYDTILDRNVAVKVLRGDLANDEKFVRRFQREALSASSLSHPNIVEVYDVGEDNGEYYIVMEYIEGKQLKELLKKRGKLTTSEVIDIMLQITDGLSVAHDSYIIHRDIKPQNIMILENGLVKITDFGIAMALNSTQLTQTNSVMGSVHYIPPEQASGKGSTLKSDIYSMGIVMYELLTGSVPYKGENAVEIALKQIKEPIPSIKNELPNLPQSVENIIIKATAKNVKNRYNDAREMHEDLKTCLDESRINEPKIVLPYPEFDDKDKTKAIKKKDLEVKDNDKKEVIAHQVTDDELKKENKLLITLAAIFTGLVVAITAIIVLLPIITNQKEIKVPDVANMELEKAIDTLQDAGFKIADEEQQVTSADIEKNHIVRTSPAAGTKRTKGTKVTLYVSMGDTEYTLEDFKGQNYLEAKGTIEGHGISTLIEKEDVDEDSDIDDNAVIRTDPEPGTRLTSKDQVTIYIPNVVSKYPDFTSGDYTVEEIQEFCDNYGVTLKVEEKETDEYGTGTIFYQSRPEGYTIVSGTTLTIRVAKAPEYSEEDCKESGLC